MWRRLSAGLALMLVASLLGALAAGCPQGKTQSSAKPVPITTIKRGTITFGIAPDYPPFEVRRGPTYAGFDIELAREISRRLKLKAEFKETLFDSLIRWLKQHKVDAVISAMTITADRAKQVAFTDSYFSAGQVIVTSKRIASLAGPAGLKGKTVGAGLGTTSEKYARERIPGATVKTFRSTLTAFQALERGEVDAVIVDNTMAEPVVAKSRGRLKTVGGLLSQELYGIAVNTGDTALQEGMNTALADIKADGTYQRLYDKWFGIKP